MKAKTDPRPEFCILFCVPQLRGILVATILGSSLAFLDASVVNVILPSIQREFGQNIARTQWVIHSYGLFLSTFLLLGGALGDRLGRKRIFKLGLLVFLAGSTASGAAPSLELLLVARAVQGLGAALLTPESLAIIEATFPEKARPRAIGIWSSFSAITAAIGPPFGGILADHFGWRTVFLINLPIGWVAWKLAQRSIPEDCGETLSSKLDFAGTLASTFGVGGVILGMTRGSPGFALSGCAFLALFVAIELRSRDPLLPLHSFRSRSFSVCNALTLFVYAPLGGTFFYLPLHWISVEGYSATQAGAAVLPAVLSIFALSPLSGMLLPKLGARVMLAIGPLVTGIGYFLISRTAPRGTSYWEGYFPGLLLIGMGMAIVITPLTVTALRSLGESRTGLASGFNNAVARLAGLIGVAWASLQAGHTVFLVNSALSLIAMVLGLSLRIKRPFAAGPDAIGSDRRAPIE